MRHLGFLALGLSVLASCQTVQTQSAPASAEAAAKADHAYKGVYAGTYVCARGENGITVSVDRLDEVTGAAMAGVHEAEGRLWFYDTTGNTGHPAGAFKLSGILTNSNLEVMPDGWLSAEPSNWGAAGIRGDFVEEDGEIYLDGRPTGPGTSACQPFRLQRLSGL